MLSQSVFFMSGHYHKFETVEYLHPFPRGHDLHFEHSQQFIRRVVLHPQKWMSDVDQKHCSDFLDDVVEK